LNAADRLDHDRNSCPPNRSSPVHLISYHIISYHIVLRIGPIVFLHVYSNMWWLLEEPML